jgi:hypothetical protein
MVKLMLQGDTADIELTKDPEDGQTIATCVSHPSVETCGWTERYDTLDDASEYAADHADYGRS